MRSKSHIFFLHYFFLHEYRVNFACQVLREIEKRKYSNFHYKNEELEIMCRHFIAHSRRADVKHINIFEYL